VVAGSAPLVAVAARTTGLEAPWTGTTSQSLLTHPSHGCKGSRPCAGRSREGGREDIYTINSQIE